ncbi:ChaN family lipoprotein [Comamonas sp. GB3 AK4-5]|uniref:ChaN family lipoprotein n=1 Tax=Comamonas sp. GB3 AK4-5 TaxID=3231487 RepID=UPI00351E7974
MLLKTILIHMPARHILLATLFAAALTGCSSLQPDAAPVPPGEMDALGWQQQLIRTARTQALPAVLLLGEQHDAPAHQQWEHDTVQALAQQNHLAAVVLEMAHAGHDTRALAPDASEGDVQAALQWESAGWPWARYAPVVMAAVQAGVPVYGGNLVRNAMRGVMQQSHWEQHLESTAWERQREAIRTGHCGLLPENQLTPMARIQLAKDERLAQTAKALLQPGKTVLIVAGRGHVLRDVGIPTWLPPHISTGVAVAQAQGAEPTLPSDRDWLVHTPAVAPQDHCATLEQRWKAGAPGTASQHKP